jgi:hypothetical protein
MECVILDLLVKLLGELVQGIAFSIGVSPEGLVKQFHSKEQAEKNLISLVRLRMQFM